MRRRGCLLAGAVAATAVAGSAPGAFAHQEDAFPPLVLAVADVTGDDVTDVVAGQPRGSDPRSVLVRLVEGARGRVLWEDDVRDLDYPVRTVSLGGGRGIVVAGRVSDGDLDPGGHSIRLRVVGGDGAVRWSSVLTARTVVPDLFPTYVRPALRGVLHRAGAPDLLLVEWATRVEAGAGRGTRLDAALVDAATGETVAEHGPFDIVDDHAELRPVPAAHGAPDAFGVLTMPATLDAGPGTLRVHDAASGAARWTAEVRASRGVELGLVPAGDPPAPALAVTAHADDDVGLRLIDPETGEPVLDRADGNGVVVADGSGAARRLRTWYFTDDGGPNGYAVELLDTLGSVVRRAEFPVGDADTHGLRYSGMDEAGDVDGDGWLDLLVHVRYSVPDEGTASDDRIVDGRTLRSVPIPDTVQTLLWTGARSAAVDGRGDDVYVAAGHTATVLDGRTLRPLLRVSSGDHVGPLFGVRDGGARCADVVVATYDAGGFALTRLGPRGEPRWSTRAGAVWTKDLAGTAGCTRAAVRPPVRPRPPAAPPAIPATGGLPAAGVAAACAAGAALAARTRRVVRSA